MYAAVNFTVAESRKTLQVPSNNVREEKNKCKLLL